ncbi:uncharacterized protein LOC116351803 [Contarinia nasturtii]|uniref:uncharacterized protein LOC116351803 n=1 Tax=Contarinia nasturtii TaxID=265458 RepID=UPI0012D48FA2|nr:uncharacterized protein LOC116351803 [Contarinia nasturtii]
MNGKSFVIFVLATVTVCGNPDDPVCLTTISRRIPLIPDLQIAPATEDLGKWMKKCCNRTKYDPVLESKSFALLTNSKLDRIVVTIKDLLTGIMNRARYTDLEFDTNFNKVAHSLHGLLLESPKLKDPIEKICYDVHANMCRIKPTLHNAGMIKVLKYAGFEGYSNYLAEKDYGNHQIEHSRSNLIRMPLVKAAKIDVNDAIRSINRIDWLYNCTMPGAEDDIAPIDLTNSIPNDEVGDDLRYVADEINKIAQDFEASAKNGNYQNFDSDKSRFDTIASVLAGIYNNNYEHARKMFHVDCVCHDMYNILTFMKACEPRKPVAKKRLFGLLSSNKVEPENNKRRRR